jgi:hypothetical protein
MTALRSAAPSYVPDEAIAALADKIMFVQADAKRGEARVSTRDQLAQAKSLKRIAECIGDADGFEHPFAELAGSLANLDQGTFDLIQAAERGAILAVVDRDGVFVDGDGEEHRFLPPTIQVVRQSGSVWFPRGIEGFIESVAQVIAGLEMLVDDAGRRQKPWQETLADLVVAFWRDQCSCERQAANRSSKTDRASPIVEFGKVVFDVAQMRPILSGSGLANLLHARQAESGEMDELDWRDFAGRK